MELDLSPLLDSWQYLVGGLGVTLLLSLLTVLCSLALGGAIGLARCYGPAWLRRPLVFYIDSMRAVPVLVVLVWTYFAFPILTGWSLPEAFTRLVAAGSGGGLARRIRRARRPGGAINRLTRGAARRLPTGVIQGLHQRFSRIRMQAGTGIGNA